ncbi:hypothetical protein HIM_06276 [Hirsutella minnesotensis 3608]|uniref:Flavodoxin-like domain-containing protein n=1 Tax=Hirsutella minnesotensis 3608 TaxID=1043627 RepID=A0A0F7ZNS7_9HYPO|nr:hypothetical protein HIM_06276 [Hirsutella minnesotensis 3608]
MASLQSKYLRDPARLLAKAAPAILLDATALVAVALASAAYDKDAVAGSGHRVTRNIAQRLAELKKDIVLFWGSQSGTAESFAKRLARNLPQLFNLTAMSADLSDFDPEAIALIPSSKRAIFILATYGEGDRSDNAAQFWD